jgi:hypothetical protein
MPMLPWTIALLAGLALLPAVAAQARTIDAFGVSSGGSMSPENPGGFGQVGLSGPNSFPPANDPGGKIGAPSSDFGFLDARFDWLSGTPGIPATLSINSSTLGATGRLVIFAPAGIETRATLTWDGEDTPGAGLGGQDLTAAPSGAQCGAAATADRLVFHVLEGDAGVQVEIAVADTTGATATFTQTGLPVGNVAFPYAAFTNATAVDFTSVNRIVAKLEGVAVQLTLEEITTSCDPMDLDGDLVTDVQDACPASDLGPTVVVGACATGVRNPLFPSGCTLGDLVARCTALKNARGCVRSRVRSLQKLDALTTSQRDAILACF